MKVGAVTRPKVVVVMPAYNAGRTLRMTYEELPKESVSTVILVDDGSTDATLQIARELGIEIFVHHRNYGYGANQKTCYTEALRQKIAPAVRKYANIGVRIEDDYVVTAQGLEWISKAPREIAEVEALMQQPWRGPAARDAATVDAYRTGGGIK